MSRTQHISPHIPRDTDTPSATPFPWVTLNHWHTEALSNLTRTEKWLAEARITEGDANLARERILDAVAACRGLLNGVFSEDMQAAIAAEDATFQQLLTRDRVRQRRPRRKMAMAAAD